MARLILERRIEDKGINTNINKRIVNYSIINIIKGKYLKALRSINKGKKYNSNSFKDKCRE